MPFPEDALAPHERLVLTLHPHWWYIAKPTMIMVAATILGIVIISATNASDNVMSTGVRWLFAIAIIVAIVHFIERIIRWVSTYFVLTSDRVISREGILAKRGIEIPLERINTVLFTQGIFERMIGLGDLEIESASKDGAQHFEDIKRPGDVQKEIYIQMEQNDNAKYDRMGQMAAGGQAQAAAAAAASAPPSIADQINQLAQLRDQGHISPQEFEAKKAELLNRM
jgi:uncharacterized membrane protein YdbT with pleckstrin-like domain